MKIIFSGGGTLGPVTPLLAIKETIMTKYPDAVFVWIGTTQGPEKELVTAQGISFVPLIAGKLRRYISFFNIIDIFKIIIGFFQSVTILSKEKPDACISAGGFVSVPVHWAAWFLGIPTWIHQQDVHVGLANRLMAPIARQITTALEKNIHDFRKKKTSWLGNPVRREVVSGDSSRARKLFGLDNKQPVIFATGGGTGSLQVNQLIAEAIEHLKGDAQVIHLTGKERPQELSTRTASLYDYYHVYQFFSEEMKDAYAVADVIISRGGFGTLSEIAALGKPAIIIPKPGHQVDNVQFLESMNAVVFINEKTSDGLYLAKKIKEILHNETSYLQLSQNLQKLLPRATDEDILEVVERLI